MGGLEERNGGALMGLNIILVKLIREEGGLLTKKVPRFDSAKHTGDLEFSFAMDGFSETKFDGSIHLCRIMNYEEAGDWVRKNIVSCNQKRLLDAIDYMAVNEDVYFKLCY